MYIFSVANLDVDSKEYSKSHMLNGIVAHTFNLFRNEENQVNGLIFFIDATDFTIKHQTYFGIDDCKRCFQLSQVNYEPISLIKI